MAVAILVLFDIFFRQKKTNHRMIGIFNTASLTINGGDEET